MITSYTTALRRCISTLLGAALLTATACDRDARDAGLAQPTTVAATPAVVDGRLAFDNEEDAIAFMNARTEQTPIEDLLPQNFRSYRAAVRTAFDKLETLSESLPEDAPEAELDPAFEAEFLAAIDEDFLHIDARTNEIRPNVPDGPYSAMLNEAGEIQFGNEVHRFTREREQTYALAAKGELDLIDDKPSSFVILSASESDDDGQLGSRDKTCVEVMTDRDNRRMKGEFQKNNFVGYAEMRFVTKRQSKVLGLWHRNKADYLYVFGNPVAFRCVEQEWVSVGIATSNCTDCSSTDDASGHWIEAFCGDDGTANHEARERRRRRTSHVFCDTSR